MSFAYILEPVLDEAKRWTVDGVRYTSTGARVRPGEEFTLGRSLFLGRSPTVVSREHAKFRVDARGLSDTAPSAFITHVSKAAESQTNVVVVTRKRKHGKDGGSTFALTLDAPSRTVWDNNIITFSKNYFPHRVLWVREYPPHLLVLPLLSIGPEFGMRVEDSAAAAARALSEFQGGSCRRGPLAILLLVEKSTPPPAAVGYDAIVSADAANILLFEKLTSAGVSVSTDIRQRSAGDVYGSATTNRPSAGDKPLIGICVSDIADADGGKTVACVAQQLLERAGVSSSAGGGAGVGAGGGWAGFCGGGSTGGVVVDDSAAEKHSLCTLAIRSTSNFLYTRDPLSNAVSKMTSGSTDLKTASVVHAKRMDMRNLPVESVLAVKMSSRTTALRIGSLDVSHVLNVSCPSLVPGYKNAVVGAGFPPRDDALAAAKESLAATYKAALDWFARNADAYEKTPDVNVPIEDAAAVGVGGGAGGGGGTNAVVAGFRAVEETGGAGSGGGAAAGYSGRSVGRGGASSAGGDAAANAAGLVGFALTVVGGRNFQDRVHCYDVLDAYHATRPISKIISRGASGADRLATEWAASRGVPCVELTTKIIDAADAMVAFWDGVSCGTLDDIDDARAQQKRVHIEHVEYGRNISSYATGAFFSAGKPGTFETLWPDIKSASFLQPFLPFLVTPSAYPGICLCWNDQFLLMTDRFPKSRVHWLVIPRPGTALYAATTQKSKPWGHALGIAQLTVDHADELRALDTFCVWARQHAAVEAGRGSQIVAGFHAAPHCEPLHVHIMSDDLAAPERTHYKRNHYNSFRLPEAFRPLSDVVRDVSRLAAWTTLDLCSHDQIQSAVRSAAVSSCHICGKHPEGGADAAWDAFRRHLDRCANKRDADARRIPIARQAQD